MLDKSQVKLFFKYRLIFKKGSLHHCDKRLVMNEFHPIFTQHTVFDNARADSPDLHFTLENNSSTFHLIAVTDVIRPVPISTQIITSTYRICPKCRLVKFSDRTDLCCDAGIPLMIYRGIKNVILIICSIPKNLLNRYIIDVFCCLVEERLDLSFVHIVLLRSAVLIQTYYEVEKKMTGNFCHSFISPG